MALKVLTGDSAEVACHACRQVGIPAFAVTTGKDSQLNCLDLTKGVIGSCSCGTLAQRGKGRQPGDHAPGLVHQERCETATGPPPAWPTGPELAKLGAAEYVDAARRATVIGRLTPAQKARVVAALKDARHTGGACAVRQQPAGLLSIQPCTGCQLAGTSCVQKGCKEAGTCPRPFPAVGFLGDGINDALALRTADVGESPCLTFKSAARVSNNERALTLDPTPTPPNLS